MNILKKLSCLIVVLSSVGYAMAHTGATGIVKQRMEGMGVLATSLKALVRMEKSGNADVDKIVEIAQKLQAHSGSTLTQRFPEGVQQHVSEAAPAIWENWEEFEKLSDALFNAAVRLEASALAGSVDLKRAVVELGSTCQSCHQDFRIKKQK